MCGPKLSCAGCERIVQAAAPSRPIERGLAGPGLLAHVLENAPRLPHLHTPDGDYELLGLKMGGPGIFWTS